jgi:hypothetical protein
VTSALGHLWKTRRLTLISFVVAVLLALFFATRLALATLYWADPEHLSQQPEAWMTPGYIGRSWQIDPRLLAEVLGLDPDAPPRKRTLEDIANDTGVPVETLIAKLTLFLTAQQP